MGRSRGHSNAEAGRDFGSTSLPTFVHTVCAHVRWYSSSTTISWFLAAGAERCVGEDLVIADRAPIAVVAADTTIVAAVAVAAVAAAVAAVAAAVVAVMMR